MLLLVVKAQLAECLKVLVRWSDRQALSDYEQGVIQDTVLLNESRFKSKKVKGRATSSENKKLFAAIGPHPRHIGQHLLDNAQCALHCSNEKFSILARGRSSFHLSALEATFIKSLNPLLCKQKEFIYSLKIS